MSNNIPIMWEAQNGKMVLLSSEETLKRVYPLLVLKQRKAYNKSED